MSTPIDESYELSDGIEFDARMSAPFFGSDGGYNNGESTLLIVDMDDLDGGDTRVQWFTTGDAFEPTNDGHDIVATGGRKKKINAQSGYGALLASVAELPEALKVIQSRGPATNADIWEGLAFSFVQKQYERQIKGETRKWSRLVAVEFFPEASYGLDAKAPKAGAKAEAKAPEAELTGNGIPAALEAKLTDLAKHADTHPEFMERAFVEVPGVEGDDMAESLVRDEGFYGSLVSA